MKQERSAPRSEKFQLMMSKDEISAVDRWRYAQQIPTRADALRRLVAKGLDAGAAEAGPPQRQAPHDVAN